MHCVCVYVLLSLSIATGCSLQKVSKLTKYTLEKALCRVMYITVFIIIQKIYFCQLLRTFIFKIDNTASFCVIFKPKGYDQV